jgi:hypothetical protein
MLPEAMGQMRQNLTKKGFSAFSEKPLIFLLDSIFQFFHFQKCMNKLKSRLKKLKNSQEN